MLHNYTMVKTPQLHLKSNKIIKIFIDYIPKTIYTERSEVEEILKIGRNKIMYHVYRIEAGEEVCEATVSNSHLANSLCVAANNIINIDGVVGNKIALFTPEVRDTKVVDGVQHATTIYKVYYFNAIIGKLIAIFNSPLDAYEFVERNTNFAYYGITDDATALMIRFE